MADVDNQICETVYGTQDDSHVMSDRVQTLASSIYKEFERMIKSYDENVVKELMPLVVGILEGLDQSYQEKQETDVELELLRDDNEQLLTQYEREKQLRKGTEQKYLEVEDAHDEERKDLTSKVETLESGVRMFELKAKNAQDHVTRLEDKEGEMKKEYSKLHERYTELFRTHMDYMERTKLLMGGDKIMDTGVSPRSRGGMLLPNLKPGPGSFIYNSGETPVKPSSSPPSFSITSPPSGTDSNRSLKHELKDLEKGEAEEKLGSKENKEMRNKHSARAETADKEQLTDSIQMRERSSGTIEETAAKTESESESKSESKDTSEQTLTAGDSADIKQESCDHIDKRTADDESGHRGVDMDREEENTTSDSAEMIEPIFELDEPYSYRESFPGDTMMQSPELEDIDDSTFQQAAHASPVHIAGASKKPQNESSLFEELSVEDADALGEMDDGCDITETEQENDKLSSGMSKEVENLILENTELLATKNALNVVKDDLIAKVDELSSEQEILREEINSLQTVKENLKKKVSELEVELKKTREELEKEKHRKTAENDEEEEVPMAQRKRFTRVEMARVLMERNQYKERLMELQEAVRWTEMIRASREHPDLVQSKKKGSIWNFFSNLFSTEKPRKRPITSTSLKYSAPTTQVRPIGDPNKKQRDKYNLGEKAKAYDFLQDDILADKARKEREKERREQYKQVRAHVKKDDGRMQAYGWSLPAKYNPPTTKDAPAKSLVPVPVPVYCRPLLEQEEGMKLWCAAGVNLSGGRTKDGGSVVGASVFYSNPPESTTAQPSSTEVDKLDQELKEHENGLQALQNQQISSLAWICTTTHNSSHVSVVDANNPGDILEIFHVTSSHILCIASVPGAMESDYPSDGEDIKVDPEGSRPSKLDTASTASSTSAGGEDANDLSSIGGISFVQCAMGGTAGEDEEEDEDDEEDGQVASAHQPAPDSGGAANGGSSDETEAPGAPKCAPVDQGASSSASPPPPDGAPCDAECGVYDDEVKVSRATGSPASSAQSTPSHRPSGGEGGDKSRILDAASELVRDGINAVSSDNGLMYQEAGKMSSVQATMWLGCQSGSLYVHSAVSQWKRCLHSVKLKDSALGIIHVKGRVFVALADGTVAVFHRAADGQWDLTNYHVVDLGQPQHSIRCMCVVANKQVWCGYRNKIHVLDPKTLVLEKTFDAHPRKESQVRQLAWVGDGVWVSIRLDSTLRLYHAYTHQHLQDVDIEPYVSKMLGTGKLGFSFVRITSLLISCNRLWIGTGNGVIISVPLSESNRQCVTTSTAGRPGGVIRVYTDARTDSVTPGSFIPYCSMAQAQLSFHGHRDAVKFFVAVPGAPSKGVSGVLSTKETKDKGDGDSASDSKAPKKTMLVMSGGEGYIDFRLGDTEEDGEVEDEKKAISKGEKSHLIVWHLSGYW